MCIRDRDGRGQCSGADFSLRNFNYTNTCIYTTQKTSSILGRRLFENGTFYQARIVSRNLLPYTIIPRWLPPSRTLHVVVSLGRTRSEQAPASTGPASGLNRALSLSKGTLRVGLPAPVCQGVAGPSASKPACTELVEVSQSTRRVSLSAPVCRGVAGHVVNGPGFDKLSQRVNPCLVQTHRVPCGQDTLRVSLPAPSLSRCRRALCECACLHRACRGVAGHSASEPACTELVEVSKGTLQAGSTSALLPLTSML